MSFNREDPLGSYNFRVVIDNITSAGFRECTGLDSRTMASTYREGTDPTLEVRKVPTMRESGNITLARGITLDGELWQWRKEIMDGKRSRRNVSIILMNDEGAATRQWDLSNAWPMSWTGPSLDATSDAFAIETIELAHEGVSAQ